MEKRQQSYQRWIMFFPVFMLLVFSQVQFYTSQAGRRDEAAMRAMKSWIEKDRAICEALSKRLPEETRKQIYIDYFTAVGEEVDAAIGEDFGKFTSPDFTDADREAHHQKYIFPVTRKYGLSERELQAIGSEGDVRRWPHPWYRLFPLCLFR